MKTIAWDVDDVLNELMKTWLEHWWLPSNPSSRIRYEEIIENPPHRLLGISQTDYLVSLDAFRLSQTARDMKPVEEVLEWFFQYGHRFRHLALTATPLCAAPTSAEWVMRHLGRWIRTFHVIPSPRDRQEIPRYDKNKSDYLQWFDRVDLLVDDSPDHVASARALGIPALLVSRPWNRGSMGTGQLLDTLIELLG